MQPPSNLPDPHAAFLEGALRVLSGDERLVGVAAGGSYRDGAMDEWSDLDLVIAVEPSDYEAVLAARTEIAASMGPLLAAFTGEHVGEPRLLICLYGPPALHVDLKFVSLEDAAERVEDPVVLWERDGRLSATLRAGEACYPEPDLQWIEDRFWVWVHYGATKIGRGELWEALDFLGFLRSRVLGPLALQTRGARPTGVRRLEQHAPDLSAMLRRTLATHEKSSCCRALETTVELYLRLREELDRGALERRDVAEQAATRYLAEVARRGAPKPAR
ncbi:MAG TPA: nucleotidyltransferase domain-containing protein [Thermoanaerobaculia bacterium]|nr:nucleotidyltransferase domain-containing protein [Thermoanaerobaculia bacterium]